MQISQRQTNLTHLHPWQLPPCEGRLHVTPPIVILVDANVVIKDLRRYIKDGNTQRTALFELVKSARVVMSAGDLQPKPGHPSCEPRLVVNIRQKWPEEAEAMLSAWETFLAPYILVLDPSTLPHTPDSLRVLAADPDDAPLSLLGHLLAADGFLSYDRQAFQGIHPVLSQSQQHGEYLCAFRDDLRVKQFFTLMVAAPLAAAGHGALMLGRALQQRGVTYRTQFVGGIIGAAVAYFFYPEHTKHAGRLIWRAGSAVARALPSPETKAAIETCQAAVKAEWEASSDPVTQVTRYLARHDGVSCTTLKRELGLQLTASELYRQLESHPGLLSVNAQRQWSLCGGGK